MAAVSFEILLSIDRKYSGAAVCTCRRVVLNGLHNREGQVPSRLYSRRVRYPDKGLHSSFHFKGLSFPQAMACRLLEGCPARARGRAPVLETFVVTSGAADSQYRSGSPAKEERSDEEILLVVRGIGLGPWHGRRPPCTRSRQAARPVTSTRRRRRSPAIPRTDNGSERGQPDRRQLQPVLRHPACPAEQRQQQLDQRGFRGGRRRRGPGRSGRRLLVRQQQHQQQRDERDRRRGRSGPAERHPRQLRRR